MLSSIMKSFFTSDTHFFHEKVIAYENRPFSSVEEMNETLIKNWNEAVSPGDLVYFLGDFGIGSIEKLKSLCDRLKGKKIAIRGNHDGTYSKLYKIGMNVVVDEATIKVGPHLVTLRHYPPESTDRFVIHGHVHGKKPFQLIDKSLNVSVEVTGYKPVSEKTILSLMDSYANYELHAYKNLNNR